MQLAKIRLHPCWDTLHYSVIESAYKKCYYSSIISIYTSRQVIDRYCTCDQYDRVEKQTEVKIIYNGLKVDFCMV